jgi:hypothetical protein
MERTRPAKNSIGEESCALLITFYGKGVQAMRAVAKKPVQVGFAFTGMIGLPVSESPQDIEATRQSTFHANADAK